MINYWYGSRSFVVAFILTLIIVPPVTAQVGVLFELADDVQQQRERISLSANQAEALVRVGSTYAADGIHLIRIPEPTQTLRNGRVRVDLPGVGPAHYIRREVKSHPDEQFVWHGRHESGDGFALFVVNGSQTDGNDPGWGPALRGPSTWRRLACTAATRTWRRR